ncbi:lysophospholipid acyltransferase family protein [Flammeovirga sp. SubArs3]|uniref:lysophospholipid acyltransferase family protein n=1 Tax=Flammeovirga sp. SubArs3 TaxID=2995316 RepID=UPI00248AC54F|nr:lysophospholipid acyltransferase family protein [Flammeovirga sp. SubArs3]
MKFFLKLYLIWGVSMFVLGLIILYPLFALVIWFPKLMPLTYFLNKIWAYFTYIMILIPIKKEKKVRLSKKEQYVFVANHTSFLDIPATQLIIDQFVVFLGKRSLAKAPIFGWMFRNLHICVDRGNPEKTEEMFRKSINKLNNGYSLGVFPEGTQNRTPPNLKGFKDGAYIIAIRAQKPIVPVTIVSNWKIWPALRPYLCWTPLRLVQHEPISTEGLTLEDIPQLRQKTEEIIERELIKYYPEKYN